MNGFSETYFCCLSINDNEAKIFVLELLKMLKTFFFFFNYIFFNLPYLAAFPLLSSIIRIVGISPAGDVGEEGRDP